MENKDHKEPFFSYGKAEAIVEFVELLNYSQKVLQGLPRVMVMNEIDLILQYEKNFLEWNTFSQRNLQGNNWQKHSFFSWKETY